MKKIDKAALELALNTVLEGKEPGRADQVRTMLREDGWEYAAKFCSSLLQRQRLQLKPWDRPPCRSEADDDSEAGRLLAQMLAAGMSRFEPDPIQLLNDKVINFGQLSSPSGVRHDTNPRGTEDGDGPISDGAA
jgi:hypothetical protein